jgi:tetratricopeptide (TPR) repeat protein
MVIAPARRARRALARGRQALERGAFDQAQRHFQRAARQPELAHLVQCLRAEAALRAGSPHQALGILDAVGDHEPVTPDRRQIRFLRGLAYLAANQPHKAQHMFAALADRTDAAPDECLAMAHACLLADDLPAARVYLALTDHHELSGELAARRKLCTAAVLWRSGQPAAALENLPAAESCCPADVALLDQLSAVFHQSAART